MKLGGTMPAAEDDLGVPGRLVGGGNAMPQRATGSTRGNDRASDLRKAIVASMLTIAWDLVVGSLAIGTAIVTGSIALAAFGLDAAIDGAASVLLVRRFRAERRHAHLGHGHERQAQAVVGASLLSFGVLIATGSIRSLVSSDPPSVSGFALGQAVASILVLPPLAYWKRRLAARLGSRALRGDSILTAAGAGLAFLAFLGLVLEETLGWWWADPVAALLITSFLLWEGRRAMWEWYSTRGELP
jgi:divalent metal cation (Fe/Co/Zn/Cd) transporter